MNLSKFIDGRMEPYVIWIIIGVCVVLALVTTFLIIYLVNKKKKGSSISNPQLQNKPVNKIKIEYKIEEVVDALGGMDNVETIELRGNTRLNLTLKDASIIKKDVLNKNNFRTMEMSNKLILICENIAPLSEELESLK